MIEGDAKEVQAAPCEYHPRHFRRWRQVQTIVNQSDSRDNKCTYEHADGLGGRRKHVVELVHSRCHTEADENPHQHRQSADLGDRLLVQAPLAVGFGQHSEPIAKRNS